MGATTESIDKKQFAGFKERTSCLGCGSAHPMIEVLDLGEPYLSDFMPLVLDPNHGASDCRRFPLKLVWCEQCKLVQLAHESNPDWYFRQYWYKSGITKTMREHLRQIVDEASEMVDLKAGDAVLDIGANDGTMLRMYPQNVRRCGFEPARNLYREASQGGNVIFPEYFEAPVTGFSQFKVVTAISMFYDVSEPLQFLGNVVRCLAEDGVFILQMNYLKSMLEQNAFDNIGHEHLAYYSLVSLLPLLDKAGLEVFKASSNDLNGGSIRVYCRRKDPMRVSFSLRPVDSMLSEEYVLGLHSLHPYTSFKQRIETIREKVRHYCAGKKGIYVYGASTRGSTTLQYFNILGLQYAVERDVRKIGLVTTGTWLKIIDEETGRREAKTFLVAPWHFRKEIIEREGEFIARGGELLFPMPVPTLVTSHGEREL